MKRVEIAPRAAKDIKEAVAYYDVEKPNLGMRLVEALENAFRIIQQEPAAGSARYQHLLPIPTRMHVLKTFPFLVFYIERADHISIFRVLHSKRDVQSILDSEVSTGR
jgi:toxin ParE1/3/4